MAEIAGLALGVVGIAGLFKSCIENFNIVVRAREFSEEFELLCTQVSTLMLQDDVGVTFQYSVDVSWGVACLLRLLFTDSIFISSPCNKFGLRYGVRR